MTTRKPITRLLREPIRKDLLSKIVLLAGPRQVGKTTLSKTFTESYQHLNYDSARDRKILSAMEWRRDVDLVVFDELHKMKKWKSWLKGIYDTEKRPPGLLVTGSARLDIYRKGGDSLAGRHFLYRLHPFTVREVMESFSEKEALRRVLSVGGFPEPFLNADPNEAARWRRSHLDVVLRQDMLDLEQVREIKTMELLVSLLRERVGSTVSYASLAEDLSVSIHTVKHWIEILENLYVIFKVTPYSKQISRGIKKESKYYFYDTGAVEGNEEARLENAVANALISELHFIEDTMGAHGLLHFIRDKEKNEVDFLVLINRKPTHLIEVKVGDDNFAKSLFRFKEYLSPAPLHVVQLVYNLKQEKSKAGVSMVDAAKFLRALSFHDLAVLR